jgi:phosphoglycerate dehydrogenase-like enzyme/mono/diheme cytochrome c family protein
MRKSFSLGTVITTALLCTAAAPAWARKSSDAEDVARGRYLITVGSCNDCHTPRFMQEGMKVPEDIWLTGLSVGFLGPWGTTYGPNLRLLISTLTEDEWLAHARVTRLPPMPSAALQEMNDADLRAIYRYVRHLGPAGEPAPAYVAPGGKVVAPYYDFVPKPPPASAPADPTAALIGRLGLEESATPVRELAGWAPPRKILVWNRAPQLLPLLRAAAPGVELIPAGSEVEAARLASDVDAAIGFCSKEVLSAGPRIRWIQVYGAGVEGCVAVPGVRERNLLLTNMQRVAGPVMAEHVIAMMLAFARGLQFYIPERVAGRWTEELPAPAKILTLVGKTVLVVGLGGTGTEVARRAHALGMRVTATRASGTTGPDFVSHVGTPEELLKLAADADFIVNTTPLTPATTGLFDTKFFAAAKPGAYFINVGRGGSVVQDDLVTALKSGQIAGAGLDVTAPEPLPAGHPLWRMQNVIITPHVSAQSDLGNDARFAIIRENLRRYVAGERMLSVVDVERGY